MHFIIKKNLLLNGLNLVARAISNFSPLPAYSGIKFDLTENGLTLTGSDSDISIETLIKPSDDVETYLEIKKEGAIIIEARYIIDIIKKLASDNIELEIIDGCSIKISGGNSKFDIIGMYANEYPTLDFQPLNDNLTIKSEALKQLINSTIFATSEKATRPALTGLNINVENNKLLAIATDSYRLAKNAIDVDSNLNFNITIPKKSLNEVLKSLDQYDEVNIRVSERKIQFVFGDTIIQSRLIDAKFPDTSRLIPEEYSTTLSLNVQDAIGAIDRASFIKNEDGISLIKLNASNDNCVLTSRSQEIGSVVEKIEDYEFEGSELEISFNGRYVLEALKTIKSERVILKFSGNLSMFVLMDSANEDLIQLISPVKTY